MEFIKWIFFVSRPRIWIYTAGSFAMGVLMAVGNYEPLFEADLLPLFLWLTLPANLFLYAINDVFDYETDLKNPKKVKFENRASRTEKGKLILTGIIACLPLIFIFGALPFEVKAMIFLWFILVLSYNLPPLRFKAIPLLDIFFSFNFPLWGIIGYFLASGQLPTISILGMLALFSIAMHIYTQSIDLDYDKAAGVKTSSVFIGSKNNNLLASAGIILLLAVILLMMRQYFIVAVLSGYFIFFIYQSYSKRNIELVEWYRCYIFLHYLLGFLFSLKFINY